MGNKIITEKDFWMCTGGAVPAQLQTTQLTTKKVSEHKYITVADKATSSWLDFGCMKLMLLMALIAAVVAALIVATGGAALAVVVAAGAAAGAAGAAFGAVLGSLICGQKAAAAREWLDSKSNLIIQGQQAITGDHKMICHIFGETISFAPHIKNWWQAISIGAANYIGGILEGMLAGAAVGFGIGALFAGGSALAAGGMRGLGQAGLQFLRQAPMNILRNFGASFGYAGGFTKSAMLFAGGLRGVMGLQSALNQYGNSGQLSGETAKAFGGGVFGMETGLVQSVRNIASGQPTWQDIAGLALMLTPVHQNLRNRPEADTAPRDGEIRDTDAETRDNEDGTPNARSNDGDAPRQEGEFEAFEDPIVRTSRIQSEQFSRNPNHDLAEFQRQIEGQEQGLNNLTVDEFLRNRDAYLARREETGSGRASEGSAAQERFREQALQDRIDSNIESGMSPDEARMEAESWMDTQAALHDPDQIAGGNPENVTGMGNRRINSSLGSQWKTRIGEIDRQVREQAEGMTQEQRENTYLNIDLPWN